MTSAIERAALCARAGRRGSLLEIAGEVANPPRFQDVMIGGVLDFIDDARLDVGKGIDGIAVFLEEFQTAHLLLNAWTE